jgi:hypothetical protein
MRSLDGFSKASILKNHADILTSNTHLKERKYIQRDMLCVRRCYALYLSMDLGNDLLYLPRNIPEILTSDTNLMGKHPEIEMSIHPVTPGETSPNGDTSKDTYL